MTPSISVVLPIYNRASLLVHPLQSLRVAAAAVPTLDWEIILVDDGSTEDIATALAGFADLPIRLHRQDNRGLLAARLAGLARARSETVLFLDGDDWITPGKFSRQLAALGEADVTYGDLGRAEIAAGGPPPDIRADPPLGPCADPVEFYLGLQPAPHNPIFRRSYLAAAIERPLFPPDRVFDPIAETWYYFQLAVRPARIAYVPGIWTVVGEHGGARISRSWERQAFAALRLMRAFMRFCPVTPTTVAARRRVGQCAFSTWRALPHGFRGFPDDKFLDVWRTAPANDLAVLGGHGFQRLARVLGPVRAGRWIRRWKRPPYSRLRTLSSPELAALVHE